MTSPDFPIVTDFTVIKSRLLSGFIHPIRLEVRNILAEFPDFFGIVPFDLRHVVNVRAFHELAFPFGEVIELAPEVGAVGVGSVCGLADAGENRIFPIQLIHPGNGVSPVFYPVP